LRDTDESAEDEEDDEDASEGGFAGDVAVSDSGHGDDGEVRPVPVVVLRLVVGKVRPRVAAQFRLTSHQARFYLRRATCGLSCNYLPLPQGGVSPSS